MTVADFDLRVKRLLDGELTLADLPPELQAEGQEALQILQAVDRDAVELSSALDARVMAAVRPSAWRWLNRPREVRLRVRAWMAGPLLAAAAALVLLLGRPATPPSTRMVTVRFVLFAPDAHEVAVAVTFYQWDAAATPLVRASAPGVWSATVTLPAGSHQYAFVVDGARWVPDPGAPAVDDGFGRRNSILAL